MLRQDLQQGYATLNSALDLFKQERATATSSVASEKQIEDINACLEDIKSHVSELQHSFSDWVDGSHLPIVKYCMNLIVKQFVEETLGSNELKDIFQSLLTNSSLEAPTLSRDDVDAEKMSRTDIQMIDTMPRCTMTHVSEDSSSQKWATWFGTLHYRSRVVRAAMSGDNRPQLPNKDLESSWTFVPSMWFINTAYSYQLTKSIQGWTHQIQCFSVVPRQSKLFEYAEKGDINGVRGLLVARQANPNDCDADGYTALHRAAALRYDELCRFLLQNGANVNAAGFVSGETPLHHMPLNRSRARSDRIFNTARVLVQAGSSLDKENSRRQTPLQMFGGFFNWPGRIALREAVAKCLVWLEGNAWDVTSRQYAHESAADKLYNGMNINHEVEKLDHCLKPDSEPNSVLSDCPRSIASGWTALHVLMHFRVEPVWHSWFKDSIFQQKDLWTQAMSRAMKQGIDPHTVDLEGHTPTSLALRSLFTFHVWQNALLAQGYDLDDFVAEELTVCAPLRRNGWTHESLRYILNTPTERLYLHGAAWREVTEFVSFKNGDEDGLYIPSRWFQLLDILKNGSLLPSGWQTLVLPRKFSMAREVKYWNKDQNILSFERPRGSKVIELFKLEGRDLVKEMARVGVVWQG